MPVPQQCWATRCLLVCRQFIPDDVDALSQLVDGDFEDLIRKIRMFIKLFEDKSEKKTLEVEVHPSRSIDADEAGMKGNISEYPF